MGKIFKRGLLAIAPISLSIAILVWLLKTMEDIFGYPVKLIIGPEYYFPGLGLIVAIVLTFIIGSIINIFIIQKISDWGDRILKRIPFFKTFYNSIYDMMNYFKPKEGREGKVVLVEVSGIKTLGLITREDFHDLPKGIAEEDEVTVFIPLSYQIGGFTMLVARSKLTPVDISVERGMRFMMTAGVGGTKIHHHEKPS